MGWFYGFQLHLVSNDKGEILSFYLSKGNVDDRNGKAITKLTEEPFGDKGISPKRLLKKGFPNIYFHMPRDNVSMFFIKEKYIYIK